MEMEINFVDRFSFSATSMFLKLLQYYGGGITVRIFGHPEKKNIPFDSNLSPTIIINNDTLYFSEDYKKLYDNYKFNIQMGIAQPFYTLNNISIPLKYLITLLMSYNHFMNFSLIRPMNILLS